MRPGSASVTMPRRTTSSGHSDNPATAMTNSGSNVWPATAAVATALRASSDRPAARSSTASRTLSGMRDILTLHQFQASRARHQAAAGGEGRAELAHEEGNAVGTVKHRSAQRRRNRAECLLEQGCAGLGIEWLDSDLPQPGSSAQLAAQPSDRVSAWQLVATERAQHQQWFGVQRTRQGAQQLRRRVVSPLEIVKEQHCRTPGCDSGQSLPDRLEERGAITHGCRRAELRKQHGEVAGQGTFDEWHIARRSQVRPQPFDDRPEGRRAALDGEALQGLQAGAGQGVLGQRGLADPRLAGEQDQRPVPSHCLRHPRVQLGSLRLSADQLLLHAVILWRNARSPPLSDPRQLHRSTSSTPRFAWLPGPATSSRSSSRCHRAALAR